MSKKVVHNVPGVTRDKNIVILTSKEAERCLDKGVGIIDNWQAP